MARASGPQAQAPTDAPATPARRVPGDPMAARRPRAALDAQPHRHARDSTAATGRTGALIHVSCNHLPAAGIDTPPVKSFGVVFFRSGGDGGQGGAAAVAAGVVGVEHVGQVSQ